MDGSDYIRTFSFVFLKRYKEKTERDSSGVLFNKYMIQLNRKLLFKGVDMHLPHCWYRQGDEVIRCCMPFIDWNHGDSFDTCVRYCDQEPRFNQNDPNVKYATDYADLFISKHGEQEEAIDEEYATPFSFQNNYRELIGTLKNSRKDDPIENHHSLISVLFENTVASFPPEFGFLGQRFEEFKSTFRLALSINAKSEELLEISETFWFFFCYHLRLNSLCHENVPHSTLEVWREALPAEENKYRMFVQNQAAEFDTTGNKDAVIDQLLRDREQRLNETESLFMEIFA